MGNDQSRSMQAVLDSLVHQRATMETTEAGTRRKNKTVRCLAATCRCGQTALEIAGGPILSAVCCCESCRTAGRQFESLRGASPVLRPDGGTDYCLYRKDRVRITSGAQ